MLNDDLASLQAPTPSPESRPTRAIDHEVTPVSPKGQKRQGGDKFNFPYDDFYTSFPIMLGGVFCCFGVLGIMKDFYKEDWDDPLVYGTLSDDFEDAEDHDQLLVDNDGIQLVDQQQNPIIATSPGAQIHRRQQRTDGEQQDLLLNGERGIGEVKSPELVDDGGGA